MFPGLARRLRTDGVDGIPHARRKIAGGLRPRQLRVRARGENGVSAGEGRRRHYAESLRAVHERARVCRDGYAVVVREVGSLFRSAPAANPARSDPANPPWTESSRLASREA